MSAVTNKPVTMPDAFIILFFVMILAAVASHLIPAGSFTLTEPAPVAEGAAKFLGYRSLQLDGEIGNAAPRIQLVGADDGLGGTQVHASVASALASLPQEHGCGRSAAGAYLGARSSSSQGDCRIDVPPEDD